MKRYEMQAIVRKRQERLLVDTHKKELIFRVRGTTVGVHKIERWMTRNNVCGRDLYAPNPAVSKSFKNLAAISVPAC